MAEDLQKKLNELRARVSSLRKEVETTPRLADANRAHFLGLVKPIEDAMAGIATAVDSLHADSLLAAGPERASTPQARPISDFFEEVAKGVVATQKALDAQSRRYISETDPLMPVSFRMPKASAELSFGFESGQTTGFNIILASDREEERETMQHKVSFDIVAAPPPPDYMARLSAQSAEFPFIGGTEARQAIRQRLRDHTGPESAAAKALAKRFKGVICFADESQWVLLEPKEIDGKPAIGLARLSYDGTSFTESDNKQANFEGKFRVVFDLLKRIQDQQAVAER